MILVSSKSQAGCEGDRFCDDFSSFTARVYVKILGIRLVADNLKITGLLL